MKLTVVFLILLIVNSYPQSDWIKWGKANINYEINNDSLNQRDFSLANENFGGVLLKSLADIYWIFISDVDGDNCSFHPTCSEFFLQGVKKTNLVQGTLMFADRFTRDLSLLKLNHYPRIPDGHFYDPVSHYILDRDSIKIIPPGAVVNPE